MSISPKNFGLPPRTVLEQLDDKTIAIIIDRKSRIIMADGKKIIEKANKITSSLPSISVALKTSAPVCSKTAKLLESNGIALIPLP